MSSRNTMLLMHLDRIVLSTLYDTRMHEFSKILKVYEPAHVPIRALDSRGCVTLRGINDWWQHRCIPLTRDDADRLIEAVGVDSFASLLEASHGLSLSDSYWVQNESENLAWRKINFYENPFGGELSDVALNEDLPWRVHPDSRSQPNPTSSTDGDLKKAWTIRSDGARVLYKAGRGREQQEPVNEYIATKVYEENLKADDFCSYEVVERNRRLYSVCSDFVKPGEDLVTAYDILHSYKRYGCESPYDWCVTAFEMTGIEDAEYTLSRMFGLDYVLANYDRHYNNFGVIRDAETLEFKRLAPIYDSGSSLWCNVRLLEVPADFAYRPKPFMEIVYPGKLPDQRRMLHYVRDYDWFSKDFCFSAPETAREILAAYGIRNEKERDAIAAKIEENVSDIATAAEHSRARDHARAHMEKQGIRRDVPSWEKAQSCPGRPERGELFR